MSKPKFRIYNAYFNEYALDITYFGDVLYAKVNELKVYLTINIENIQEVLNKLFYAYGTFTNTNTGARQKRSMGFDRIITINSAPLKPKVTVNKTLVPSMGGEVEFYLSS
jgi:hypothetical protein